jgi:predicted ArsR family transcriptional regulator
LLDEPRRRQLYEFVISSDREIGRDEAAAKTGMGRALASFHLDRLAKAGLLTTTYRRLSGRNGPGAGRPAKLYKRAPETVSVSFPARRYEAVADVFAESLDRLADDSRVGALVTKTVLETAREHGRTAGAESGSPRRASPAVARQSLVDMLAEHGYEPSVDADTGSITLRNCPYQLVSAEHREMTCGTNQAWAEGVLESISGTGLAPTLAPQPGRCCVIFSEAS